MLPGIKKYVVNNREMMSGILGEIIRSFQLIVDIKLQAKQLFASHQMIEAQHKFRCNPLQNEYFIVAANL